MEEFRVSLGLEIKDGEIAELKKQIDNIKLDSIDLKLDTSSIQKQITFIKKQIQSIDDNKITLNNNGFGSSNSSIQKTVADINKAYNDLMDLQRRVNSIRKEIGGLDASKSSSQITELSGQLNRLMTDYNNLYRIFERDFSTDQIDRLNRAFEVTTKKIDTLNAKVKDAKTNLANVISTKVSNGTFDNDISKINSSLSKLENQSEDVTASVKELNTALSSMRSASNERDIDRLISSYKEYENALKKVKNQIDINARAEKEAAKIRKEAESASKLNMDKTAFSSSIDVWLKKNSAAAKEFGAEIDALKLKIQSCDKVELDNLKAEFKEITRQAELAGKTGLTFRDNIKSQFAKIGSIFSVASLMGEGMMAARSMFDNVLDVDTAMTSLYRVTDLSSEQYSQLYDDMSVSAKNYGATLTDIITATADWVQLGFDVPEASRLSEIAAMYQHIADLDNDTAVENLVTAYKGFEKELLELYDGDSTRAMEYIADIYNDLGNKFALSSADVGEGVKRCASALDLAGNTIQETAAMVTGITEVTQDPARSGTALKILSMRLRGKIHASIQGKFVCFV